MPVVIETPVGRAEFRKGRWSSEDQLLRRALERADELISVDGWAADWEEQYAREALRLVGGGEVVSVTEYPEPEPDDRRLY